MSVYTVHEPLLRGRETSPDPDRFVFVRDGFYFWAFVFSLLWLIWHRLWLALIGYIVVVAVLEAGLRALGVSNTALSVAVLLVSLLVGLEGSTLRRLKLARRGWKTVGVVSAVDLEDAERRFFGNRVDSHAGEGGAASLSASQPPPPPLSPSAPPAFPRASAPPGIVGLFPEPGASR
jgi:hypothetical protein